MSVLWRQGTTLQYAASIAATWVWAPAIFVASSMAYSAGLYGFLWFLIPNVLTLFLFGYISSKVTADGWNIGHVVQNVGSVQAWIHKIISTILLICSTVVQFIGVYTLTSELFGFDKTTTAVTISLLSLAMVWFNGLKSCIMTDGVKYVIMLVVGAILAYLCLDSGTFYPFGHGQPTLAEVSANFGIITAVGLLSAPYADQTFWQRAFSIPKEKRFATFSLAGALFSIIPILFGICGFMNGSIESWSIATAFGGYTKYILFAGVLSALISTIDSNLCAFSSLYVDDSDDSFTSFMEKLLMVVLLCVASLVFIGTDITIVQLFLLYGTIRTCLATPTLLAIFDSYSDAPDMATTTIATAIACPLGYAYMSYYNMPYIWIVPILALVIPLMSYSYKSK